VVRGVDVPSTFVPLNIGEPVFRLPRRNGCLCAGNIQETGVTLDATVPATLYAPSLGPFSTCLKSVPHRGPSAHFSLKFTGERGAALVTRYPTYSEDIDAQFKLAFETYTINHYDSWVKFAHHMGYGTDVQPVLVTGLDFTKDLAMLAYSNGKFSLEANLVVDSRTLSASTSIRVTGNGSCSAHYHQWPTPWSEQPEDFPPVHQIAPPRDFNRCVFIRYNTGVRRMWQLQIMKAGAGPHDLGPGDNRGGAFPELTVQSDVEAATGDDGNWARGQSGPTTGNASSEPVTVTSNTSYVWMLVMSFCFY